MEKALLLFYSLLLLSSKLFSQDFLTKTDGETILVKIKEISPNVIWYYKSDDTVTKQMININDVFSVQFANGVKQVFKSSNGNGSNNNSNNTNITGKDRSPVITGSVDRSPIISGDVNKVKIKTTVINVTGNTIGSGKTNSNATGSISSSGTNVSEDINSNHERVRSSDGRCSKFHFGYSTFVNDADFPVEIIVTQLMILSPQTESFKPTNRKLKIPAKEKRQIAEIKPGSYNYKIQKSYTGKGYPTTALPILDEGQIYITECEELEVKIR